MAPRASASPRPRRTQAERTATTRRAIVQAVVESLAEQGFQKTTANEIARRAGVTWGAVQHHFGGKDGILDAVLEDSFARFAERLGDVAGAEAPLAQRISDFVDRAWEHFGSPDYRSTFEILLNHTAGSGGADDSLWQSAMFRSWNRIWSQIFADVDRPRRQTVALQTYTISVLSGMASLAMLRGQGAPLHRAELDVLKRSLLREMTD